MQDTPTVTAQNVKDLNFFGVTAVMSYKNSKEEVEIFKKLMISCLSQKRYQPDGAVDFVLPSTWKTILKPWMTVDVWNLLNADHIVSLDQFFIQIQVRLLKTSNTYDTIMLDWIRVACTESNIDKQTNEFRKFLKKALDQQSTRLSEAIIDHLAIPEEANVSKVRADLLEQIAGIEERANELAESTIKPFVLNLLSTHLLMSLIGQNDQFFQKWDADHSPKTATHVELSDFYMRHSSKDISFKTGGSGTNVKKVEELTKQVNELNNKVKFQENTIAQLRNGKQLPPKGNPVPRTDPQTLKRAIRTPYTGPPCTKCQDAAMAKSHSTEAHKDNYIPKAQFNKKKISKK